MQRGRLPKPVSACPGPDSYRRCLCVRVSNAESVGVCVVKWTHGGFKPSHRTCLGCIKFVCACLLDRKLFTFSKNSDIWSPVV